MDRLYSNYRWRDGRHVNPNDPENGEKEKEEDCGCDEDKSRRNNVTNNSTTLPAFLAGSFVIAVAMLVFTAAYLHAMIFRTEPCLDVAIIGGGVGGAYMGWKLKDKKLDISVFEYSDRVGGRIMSANLPTAPGTWVDFGAVRFSFKGHPKVTKAVQDLGLKVIPFTLGYGLQSETLYYIRAKRLRTTGLGTSQNPCNLGSSEFKSPDDLIRQIFTQNVNVSGMPTVNDMYHLITRNGMPLYKMSLDHFWAEYASREAYKYIRMTFGWADIVGTHGALRIPKIYSSGTHGKMATVEGGMEKLPKGLMQGFVNACPRNQLILNQQLIKIRKNADGKSYSLTFRKTQTVDGVTTPVENSETTQCAKKVVLTMERSSIVKIDFPTFKDNTDITDMLNSVVDIPAGKIFLVYKTKWWNTNINGVTNTKTDLPNRKTFEWKTGKNNVSILLASYHDAEYVKYWRDLSTVGTPIPGSLPGINAVTDAVKRRLEKYLSLTYNFPQEDIPAAIGGGMMLWGEYPFEAAWTFYKPGVDERLVYPRIYQPSPTDDVYIIGDTWAVDDLHTWIEGSLSTADYILDRCFYKN